MSDTKPPNRRFTEGIVTMSAGLTFVILGANVLGCPNGRQLFSFWLEY